MWRHVAPPCATVVPRGAAGITWPADLTTANRRAHNSEVFGADKDK